MSFEEAELFEDNPDPRLACCLLLDCSYSMSGKPIQQLNEGLQAFRESLLDDERARRRVEICVVRFGPVEVLQPFGPVDQLNLAPLQADGNTPLGEALLTGLDLLERRKAIYKQNGIHNYYRPWMFLITDGAPTDHASVLQEAQAKLGEAVRGKHLTFFPVGVEDADMDTLKHFNNGQAFRLHGLHFREFFLWLSSSVGMVSRADPGSGGISLQKPSDNVMTIEI